MSKAQPNPIPNRILLSHGGVLPLSMMPFYLVPFLKLEIDIGQNQGLKILGIIFGTPKNPKVIFSNTALFREIIVLTLCDWSQCNTKPSTRYIIADFLPAN